MGGFVTEWAVSGDATARTITLPLASGWSYNFNVNWGDGAAPATVSAYDDANRIHTYASNGTYQVGITGQMEGWSFEYNGVGTDALKLKNIISWNNNAGFTGFKYLQGGFTGCSNLVNIATDSIPAPVSGGVDIDGFADLFSGCSKLISVASNLFSLHPTARTSAAFRYTFYGCSSLTSIPSGLFDANTLASGFSGVFQGCSTLTSIPTDLFKYNTAATTFSQAFMDCTKLVTVPAQLFKNQISATNFSSTFQGCDKLTINKNLFYDDGDQATRFLNKTINFSGCFYRDSWTGTSQGTAPDLWNCDFGSATPTKNACFIGGGNSTTSISNYASIPAAWE